MADQITIGAQAIKEIQILRAELVELSKDALVAGKSMSTITTPGGLNKSTADNQKTLSELEAIRGKYDALSNEIVNLNEKLKKLNETRANGKKLTADEIVQRQAERKAAIDTAKANSELIGSYDKLNLKHQQAVKNAQNMAVTYGETSKQFIKASKTANDLDAQLKSIDSTLGKNQRNVGNYKSGFNALGNSINQLTREAPAFANSINTGFMAISNNIPALTDAIKGIREQNALLRAEGKPTVSVFKQLAGGIFSWQTAISLGVTLLTLYGGKLIDLAFGLSEAEKAQESFNEQLSDSKNSITSEAVSIESLTSIVNDHNESSENRKLAYDEIKKTLPGLTSATYEEAIATGELTRATDLYILSLVQKNIVETEAKLIAEEQTKLNKETAKSYTEHIGKVEAFLQSLQPERQRKNIEKSMKAQIKAEQDAQQEIINNRQKALVKAQEDYLKTQSQLTPFITKPDKEKIKKAQKEDVTPKVQALESSLKPMSTIIGQINEEIDRLTVERIVSDDSALPAINFQLKQLVKLKQQINGLPEVDLKIVNTTVKSKEAVKQLSEEMKNYLKTFSIDFAQSTGFTETFALLNDEIDGFGENFAVTFNAIAESAQEVFNFISNASQKNFDKEKERLQSQYDIALTYAGDNKAAQEKLADDLAKKKEEIANRENKAKQQQAKFNIALDTAQAIIGLWANPGFPQAIPLSIVVGALGIAQLAMVNSQEIPKYWMGGTHDGGLMMVNDGSGSNYRETIVTPDGNIHKPQGRNVIMNAPVGTEIFTHDQWNEQLNNMLQGKGISMSLPQHNSGITKEDLEDVFMRTLGEQPQSYTNFDGNGVTSYIVKRGNITRINTNRSNGKGIRF